MLPGYTVLSAAALALVLAACGNDASSRPELDGVIIFTVDTLRADQLGAYGNTSFATLSLDRLAGDSLVFGRAYSQATLTYPALTSMLTGMLPHRHGVLMQAGKIVPGVLTLPQMLKAKGYDTGSFVANLCKRQKEKGSAWHEGWDVTYCGLGMDEEYEQWAWDEDVVTEAMKWIESRERPYMAWIHLMDPHAEHRPPLDLWDYESDPPLPKLAQYKAFNSWEIERTFPEGADKERLWDLYAAEVIGIDRQVGRFLDFFDEKGLADTTALIFSADHGEELYETWSRFDHGFALTEGVLWVPLMVRAPGVESGWCEDPVELLQVTPTVLDLFGLPALYALDGASLLADEPSRGYAFSSVGQLTMTLRDKTHRYYLRATPEPWTRPPDQAPWRADAPWFKERQGLVSYPHEVPTAVSWLDHLEDESKSIAHRFLDELEIRARELGQPPDVRTIDDPDALAELAAMGYTGVRESGAVKGFDWDVLIRIARRELQ